MFCQLACTMIMNHTVLTGLVRLSLYLLVQERIQSYTKSQSSQVEQLKHSSHLRLNLKSKGLPAMRIQFWNLHLISSHPYLQIQVICHGMTSLPSFSVSDSIQPHPPSLQLLCTNSEAYLHNYATST